jgi:hypothetical protein
MPMKIPPSSSFARDLRHPPPLSCRPPNGYPSLRFLPAVTTIIRSWHGWTSPEDAEACERLIEEEIYPSIADKTGEGYRGYEFARRDHEDEVEYVTITRFASWEAVERFVGEDDEQAPSPTRPASC